MKRLLTETQSTLLKEHGILDKNIQSYLMALGFLKDCIEHVKTHLRDFCNNLCPFEDCGEDCPLRQAKNILKEASES